jgi:dTDP-glucose 4,6-dehydratase
MRAARKGRSISLEIPRLHRLLVTGGAGFIGSNFVSHWVRANPGDRVVVLDALTYAGNAASLEPVRSNPDFRFVRGDICDTALVEKLLREENVDVLVHFAAESHVDRSILGPDQFITTNVVGTHSLLMAARKVWLQGEARRSHRFHHVSTDEVYGSLGPNDPAFTETTPYAPNSPYSASKAASDHLVRSYHHTYHLDVTTSNCSNNYGPYHFPEKLIPLAIVNLLEGRPLPIYGDGKNIRDWLHVSDHCLAIDAVVKRGKPGEVYNVGGRAESTNIDLVRALCAVADAEFARDASLRGRFPKSPAARGESSAQLITFVRDRPGHDRRYAIDSRKIESRLGYVAATKLEDGLRDTFRWYVANEPWWRAIMDGSYQRWIETQYSRNSPSSGVAS